MVSEPSQFVLPFPHDPSYHALDFLPSASNREAMAWLDRMAHWPDRRLAVWGQPGCGKTHLLRIWAARFGAVLLSGAGMQDLDAMPEHGAIALDDADRMAPDTLLLHLLNIARDRGLVVLLAGRTAPARWTVQLPDLASRLRAITAVEVGVPDDELLRSLLLRLLADRQLAVAEPVQAWLLRRLPRAPAALRDAVAELDRASLAYRRSITRSLAARLLALENTCQDDEVSMTERFPACNTIGTL